MTAGSGERMTNEELARQVSYVNAKINALIAAIAIPLAAFPVRTHDGKNFSEFLGELVEELPKGRTEHAAAAHKGARDALTRLSKKIDAISDSVTVQFGD